MEEVNIFDQNVDYLIQARSEISHCSQLEQQKKQLQDKEEKMRKAIQQEEKSINDEINSTIKKRKSEIEDTYDSQLDTSRKKMKKAQEKKNKEKSERVGQRVDEETADVKENSRQLKTEMKTLFKKNHVPGFCQSGLYYILFMPKGMKEFLCLFLLILLGLAALPYGVYMLFSQVILVENEIVKEPYFMAVVIGVTLILVLGIYFLIFNLTKVKHRDTIAEGRKIRNQILANDKNVRAIKNAINKDKDESQYELGAYDAKINQFQDEMDSIAEQKQAALTEFEQNTRVAITNEINGRRLGKLEDMRQQKAVVEEERNSIEEQLKETSLDITNKYTKYLGKNICKEEVLNDIINIMETEQINTISEGLAIYKGEVPHKEQQITES
ncbi:MAG: hypothetical protein NC089_13315 [Bacteroides sp.]|nr:hypothetical protein [Bacteroides sp.]MCM1550947.1 hypothetical protein [Clostridium sp.]